MRRPVESERLRELPPMERHLRVISSTDRDKSNLLESKTV
jgi:hypothetical protein